jgi:hypothetical protein
VKDKEAYVSRIDGSYIYTHGNQYHQTTLYPSPEQLLLARTATSSPALSMLSLQGFDHTAWSLILNFRILFFQVIINVYSISYCLLKFEHAAIIFDIHICADLHSKSMGILSSSFLETGISISQWIY